jgi:hypothetical protein
MHDFVLGEAYPLQLPQGIGRSGSIHPQGWQMQLLQEARHKNKTQQVFTM